MHVNYFIIKLEKKIMLNRNFKSTMGYSNIKIIDNNEDSLLVEC